MCEWVCEWDYNTGYKVCMHNVEEWYNLTILKLFLVASVKVLGSKHSVKWEIYCLLL